MTRAARCCQRRRSYGGFALPEAFWLIGEGTVTEMIGAGRLTRSTGSEVSGKAREATLDDCVATACRLGRYRLKAGQGRWCDAVPSVDMGTRRFDAVILRAGFGAIGAATDSMAGIDSILIDDHRGRTYSYRFEPTLHWSRLFAPGVQSKRYNTHVAR